MNRYVCGGLYVCEGVCIYVWGVYVCLGCVLVYMTVYVYVMYVCVVYVCIVQRSLFSLSCGSHGLKSIPHI